MFFVFIFDFSLKISIETLVFRKVTKVLSISYTFFIAGDIPLVSKVELLFCEVKITSSYSIRIVLRKLSRSLKMVCSKSYILSSHTESLPLLLFPGAFFSSCVERNIFFIMLMSSNSMSCNLSITTGLKNSSLRSLGRKFSSSFHSLLRKNACVF